MLCPRAQMHAPAPWVPVNMTTKPGQCAEEMLQRHSSCWRGETRWPRRESHAPRSTPARHAATLGESSGRIHTYLHVIRTPPACSSQNQARVPPVPRVVWSLGNGAAARVRSRAARAGLMLARRVFNLFVEEIIYEISFGIAPFASTGGMRRSNPPSEVEAVTSRSPLKGASGT